MIINCASSVTRLQRTGGISLQPFKTFFIIFYSTCILYSSILTAVDILHRCCYGYWGRGVVLSPYSILKGTSLRSYDTLWHWHVGGFRYGSGFSDRPDWGQQGL